MQAEVRTDIQSHIPLLHQPPHRDALCRLRSYAEQQIRTECAAKIEEDSCAVDRHRHSLQLSHESCGQLAQAHRPAQAPADRSD
jgi:hypothetical protein